MNPQQNDAWVTFGYEEMFRRLLHHLGPGRESLPKLPWEIHCAITESALLHARQLADILLSRTKEPTDIKLQDIAPGLQPTRLAVQHASARATSGVPAVRSQRSSRVAVVRDDGQVAT